MFKWLVVIGVVVLGYALWRHQRQSRQQEQNAQTPRRPVQPPAAPDAIITCRHCGVHLPAGDAVRGVVGLYCSDEHRRLAEG